MIKKQADNVLAMEEENYYNIFLRFIDKYLPDNFNSVRKDDPLVKQLNQLMKKNNQFFYIGDMINLDIIFTCDTIWDVLGMRPQEMKPARFMSMTHPDDIQRHGVSRSRMIRLCNDTFINSDKYAVMSSNFLFQHQQTMEYHNILVQGYVFSRTKPSNTVYCIFIQTNIDWFGKIKHGYHFYIGMDMSYFRFPDKELILTGCVFTDREYEILKLLREGLDSHEVGEKLFLSTHTVDTHRRNILKKSGKRNTSELIFELLEKGFF